MKNFNYYTVYIISYKIAKNIFSTMNIPNIEIVNCFIHILILNITKIKINYKINKKTLIFLWVSRTIE